MKKKTGIILNMAGIALILALLCMLFVPYFPAVESGADGQSVQNVSIMGYVMNPLDKVSVAPIIAQNNARLGEAAPHISVYIVPVLVTAVVGLLSIICAAILRKKLLPGLAFLLTGALTLGTFLADQQYAIGGWAYAVILVLAAALIALGAWMSFCLFKAMEASKVKKFLPLALTALTIIVLLAVFAIGVTPTDITFAPAAVGAEAVNNPYLAEDVQFGALIISPALIFAVLLLTAVLSIYFRQTKWMRIVYAVSGLLALISLLANPIYNCVFIERAMGIAFALLLTLVSSLYILVSFSVKDEAKEKKPLTKQDIDAIIYNCISVVLILAVLFTMFTTVIAPASVSFKVRAMGDTAETNPYLAKWVTRMPGPGAATLASPSLMAIVLAAVVLLSLACRTNRKLFFIHIGAGMLALYTLLSNRVFAPNPLRMYVAVPAVCVLLLLAVIFMIRHLLTNRLQSISGVNYANLIALLIAVVLMFMPYWNIEDPKSSKTPTRSVADLVTMRADKLPSDDATVAEIGKKLSKGFATSPKKTVKEAAESDKDTKKILDAVSTVVTPMTTLDVRLNSVITSERALVYGDEAQPYSANAEGLWFIPVLLIAATAMFLVLCLLRADEGWPAFASLLIAAAGMVIFIVVQELHFSDLRHYILALYAFVFVASFVNIAEFIAAAIASKRDREKYLYENANPYSAKAYRMRAAQHMLGNSGKAMIIFVIHMVIMLAILVGAYVSLELMSSSFVEGNALLFIAGAALITVCFLLFGFNLTSNASAMLQFKRGEKLAIKDYFACTQDYQLGVFSGTGLKLLLFTNIGVIIYFAAKAVMDLTGKSLSPIVYVIAAAFEIYGIFLSYKLTMMPYIQHDNAHFTANESADGSAELIKRNKWQMFCLDMSYAGWYLLSLLTGGILLLWVYPRHQLARAYYYDNLIEERDRLIKAHH